MRRFLPGSFLLSLSLVVLGSCAAGEKTAGQPPYNVLFIAVDDLRTELNCYGASHIKSPNIDRLAASGTRFTNAYVQQAICMASRASLMTGMRPEKLGMYTGEPVHRVAPDALTLNKFFKANGYTVASTGKIYHYDEDTQLQFGDDYIAPGPDWNGTKYATEAALALAKTNANTANGPAYENADVGDEAYSDGINTRHAVRKLSELKQAGKPFFLSVGLRKPHLPFAAPRKYWDMYPPKSIELPAVRKHPEGSGSNTLRTRGELTNYVGIPNTFAAVSDSTKLTLTLRRAYYACVSYADAQVGKLLAALDEQGLRENTIVVLWGDHGYKLGDYGEWCKWSNMDTDTRIPYIFSVPGQVQGSASDHVVETLDIYPTLADFCGLPLPAHLDGRSIRPYLEDPTAEVDSNRFAYSIWPQHRWNYGKTVLGYSVKNGRYNYVEWVKLDSGEVVERELYDHRADPSETSNVVEDERYAAVVTHLSGLAAVRKAATDHDHPFRALR